MIGVPPARNALVSNLPSVMANPERPVLNDRYEIQSRIGRGGMADVFLAHDRLLDRRVAVKVLFPEYATDPSFVERFRREAQAAANLNHPNIVGVYDWGRQGSTYFIVMEYVDGKSLADILQRPRPAVADAGQRGGHRGGRRPRLRPRQRHGPPRHQAGQHPRRHQRQREGGASVNLE